MTLLVLGFGMALLTGACTSGGSATPSSIPSTSRTAPLHVTPSPSGTIPQPPLAKLNGRTRRRLAPTSNRVDLAVPSFSNSTDITNPLFPISNLRSVVLVGLLEGRPWRAETTLLPETRTIEWNGQRIKTRESQFVAYLDGRIFEVAVDHYAQADDESVWYLGEDAYTYQRGRVSDTEGTWLAGLTGPPAMIMPGHPRVGDVYRTENIPGLVFEQVTVKRVDQTVAGPTGPVRGAMVGQELHMDERRLEAKTFAPGYGEFHSGSGRTFEATAVAVPTNAAPGQAPVELRRLSGNAIDVFEASQSKRWRSASASFANMRRAWNAIRSHAPDLLASQMDDDLRALSRALATRNPRRAPFAALDVARAGLDIELRYEPSAQVDRARFGLWTREIQADAAAGDRTAVIGDVSTLEWISDRIALSSASSRLLVQQLRYLRSAAEANELSVAGNAAAHLRSSVFSYQS